MAFDAFDRTGHDVFFDGEKLVQILLALRIIADALQDDLFGGLCGLAAEALRWVAALRSIRRFGW